MLLKHSLLGIAVILALTPQAFATWSILAVDTASGQMVVASATCLQQSVFPRLGARDLRDIQAVVVPGKGIAACQAESTPRERISKPSRWNWERELIPQRSSIC